MKPARTADDKVLALLARVARPLEREEIAEQLGWSKQRATAVLRRLVPDKRVAVTQGAARGTRGPRPALFSLPGAEPVKQVDPRLPYFEPNTIVLTPSAREARVIKQVGDFVEVEYLISRVGHEPRATLHARLLRAFQAGRERPEPVRIMSAVIDPSPT